MAIYIQLPAPLLVRSSYMKNQIRARRGIADDILSVRLSLDSRSFRVSRMKAMAPKEGNSPKVGWLPRQLMLTAGEFPRQLL
jgi:hypothetical protein